MLFGFVLSHFTIFSDLSIRRSSGSEKNIYNRVKFLHNFPALSAVWQILFLKGNFSDTISVCLAIIKMVEDVVRNPTVFNCLFPGSV